MTRRGVGGRLVVALAVAFSVMALASLALAPNAAAGPPKQPILWGDISTLNDTFIKVYVSCDFKVLDSGSSAPFDIVVKDRRNLPIDCAIVTVQVYGTGKVVEQWKATDEDGRVRLHFSASDVSRESETWLLVRAEKDGYTEGYANLGITTIPEVDIVGEANLWYLGVGVISVGAIFSTELGKYGFMRFLFPLYTRLKREEVLDHFVRGQIFGYIVSNPGGHYSMIKDALKVNNGTLSHHLRTLEVQGFVKSRRDGTLRRFYPVKMTIPQDSGTKLSDLQMSILDIIRQCGGEGATQRFIADMIDASQQTVSYNLRALNRHGVIRIEQDGRRARYYIQNT
jgi:DNA-binding transcriptional ArsR family regulator